MTGAETLLRRLFSGRNRRWSVTISTGLVLVVFGLPAADEYSARRRMEAELAEKLIQAEHQVERIDDLQKRADVVQEQLQLVLIALHSQNNIPSAMKVVSQGKLIDT